MSDIALCFFGITRSLKYTLPSIEKYIFDSLKEHNISYDIFLHTYSLNWYENRRNREKNITNIDNDEYKLLNPNYYQVDDQDEIKKQLDLPKYRSQQDPFKNGYNSVDNFILAQYSKHNIVNMIKKSNKQYKYIVYIRPDCQYLAPLLPKHLSLANDKTIVIPSFHQYGQGNIKFNDRFCISNMSTYTIYGDVFHLLNEISKQMPLHSESVIYTIVVGNKIDIKRINFRFKRIRFNGTVDYHDVKLW